MTLNFKLCNLNSQVPTIFIRETDVADFFERERMAVKNLGELAA